MEEKLDLIINKLNSIQKRLNVLEKVTTKPNVKVSSSENTTKMLTVKKISPEPKKKIQVQTGSLTITIHPNGCIVTGDTFDKKDIIKASKGFWAPEFKGWIVKGDASNIQRHLKDSSQSVVIKENSNYIENLDKDEVTSKSINIPSLVNKKPQSSEYEFISDSD